VPGGGGGGRGGGECPASAHLRVITAAGRRQEQTATTAAPCRFTISTTTAGAPAAGVSIHYRRRPLRSNSNDMRKLLVPRTHNKLADRSFSAAGPRLWNDLPPGLRRPRLTFDSFRQSLKTHLFGDRSA